MNESEIVPYNIVEEYEYDVMEPCVRAVPGKKRKRKAFSSVFKGMFYFLLCCAVGILIYINFDEIQNFAERIIFNNFDSSDTDSQTSPKDTNTSSDETKTNTGSTSSDDIFYNIVTKDLSGDTLENESKINLSGKNFTFEKKKLSEIYATYGKEAPIVLIIHSHANEAYSNGEKYSPNDKFYSESDNVCKIGEKICNILKENNINCIHLENVYANGTLHTSRDEYEETLQKTLKKYPSIAYVFDISRDVIIDTDMTMQKPSFETNGKNYAQIKISAGSNEISENEKWESNLGFALALSDYISESSPSLIRPCVLSRFALSQQYSPAALKIDVGAYSNTYEEALNSAELFALLLSAYIAEE